jgi:hypothetical protein
LEGAGVGGSNYNIGVDVRLDGEFGVLCRIFHQGKRASEYRSRRCVADGLSKQNLKRIRHENIRAAKGLPKTKVNQNYQLFCWTALIVITYRHRTT